MVVQNSINTNECGCIESSRVPSGCRATGYSVYMLNWSVTWQRTFRSNLPPARRSVTSLTAVILSSIT